MKPYFAINHHANVTKKNMTFAHHLINYSHNKLLADTGDADIDAIIAFNMPIVKEWNNGFSLWHDAHNFEMGSTIELNALIDSLTHTKAPDWMVKVLYIYPEGSPRATALLPHKRKAFISGTVLNRITGIKTFIDGLGDDAALATVKTDAEAFLIQIESAYAKHAKAKKILATLSKDQEILRVKATTAMLANQGSLMKKFSSTPEKIDLYFDVQAMRRGANKNIQDEGYEVSLLPSEIKLLNLRFLGTETWEIANNGDSGACIFFSNTSAVTTIPKINYTINAGESLQIDLSKIESDQRFAFAANLSSENEGELNIVLVS
jgi:hypothetical protein